ncbi:sorbitol dehydrogenase family protein [Microvirga massiliensis]|uniref:sorbitol dehydrogenase family protein n=1 Tax=Microvirga massiliensis TaxID=1033741 RepID=UPI00062BD19A|nr:sorbitol dehydrogenase family protein [Microvirga massiliensis]
MEKSNASLDETTESDPHRRTVLTGLTATCLSSFVPVAVAQPSAGAPRDAFLVVSRVLTGRPSLEPDQAARLYEALIADDPGFQASVQALAEMIGQRKIEPSELQPTLDAEHSPLAVLPRKIVTAWYTGVVGEGERARCITFETSLMYVVVADRLNPPSYCSGSYGTWVDKPA